MINALAYVGMNLQSEVCLWTLLGLIRTIFDATLFRMNANLKQVWQMSMPEQLSMPVQRTLRTMISGVMLVQCFTVYVYLASYIVLLYPVFLEERPALVLPWLLLAAIRKLLCELTSLALGLGTCVLLGPTRPPCIKFVIIKLISIMPSFYTWMLLYSYYHSLKLATAFKTFPALPNSDHDYGLELAIRRRRTKSLLGEEQLRSKIVATLYGEPSPTRELVVSRSKLRISSRMIHSTDTSATDFEEFTDSLRPLPTSKQVSETGSHEDWIGSDVVLPRDTDRILEQFVLMMLRIGIYLDKEGVHSINSQMFDNKTNSNTLPRRDNLPCPTISMDESETPPQVGSSGGNTASYLREYPQIFMKKSTDISRTECCGTLTEYVNQSRLESEEDANFLRNRKRTVSISSKEKILDGEKGISRRKLTRQESDNKDIPTTSTGVADSMERQCDQLSLFSNVSDDTTNTQQIILPKNRAKMSSSISTVKGDSSMVERDDNTNNLSPSDKKSGMSPKKFKAD